MTKVVKGSGPGASIVLHQTGGEVAGASAVMRGAQFTDGEEAIVFLGTQDAADGSYDVTGGSRGKFVVRHDSGRAVLDVRLGTDASAYSRAEKAPGTGLARIPLELFERLAAGPGAEAIADPHTREGLPTSDGASRAKQIANRQSSPPAAPLRSNAHVAVPIVLMTIFIALGWLLRRRRRCESRPP